MTYRPTRSRSRAAVRKREHYTYRVERGPTNAIVFHAVTPGDYSPCAVLWNGPGASLKLILPTELVSIEWPGSNGRYDSETDATDAFVAFFDAVAESCARHYADAQHYATV